RDLLTEPLPQAAQRERGGGVRRRGRTGLRTGGRGGPEGRVRSGRTGRHGGWDGDGIDHGVTVTEPCARAWCVLSRGVPAGRPRPAPPCRAAGVSVPRGRVRPWTSRGGCSSP